MDSPVWDVWLLMCVCLPRLSSPLSLRVCCGGVRRSKLPFQFFLPSSCVIILFVCQRQRMKSEIWSRGRHASLEGQWEAEGGGYRRRLWRRLDQCEAQVGESSHLLTDSLKAIRDGDAAIGGRGGAHLQNLSPWRLNCPLFSPMGRRLLFC